MAYPGLAHEDHKYLGKEYCTGYTDVYGKWNTGFYCPENTSKTSVFCCGTAMLKYCCTNQEPTDPNSSSSGVLLDGDDPNFDGGPHHGGVSSAVFVRVPIVFGVVCGIAAVLVLLIVASCYFCSCCFAYKKRRNDHPRNNNDLPHHHLNHLHLNHSILHHPSTTLSQTGLYRNSTPSTNSSTASSNLLNLYAGTASTVPLTNNSLVTTPLDLDWASSIASAYQPQQQYFHPPSLHFTPPPHGPGPGNALSPAAAATLAVALSQQQQQRGSLQHHTSPSPNSLLPGSGTPSVISGTTLSTSTGRLPSVSQAYQSFLNSSTSTLSSTSAPAVAATRGLCPPQPQLHRANLPQQISSTASIVNSYLASLQSAQHQHVQSHSDPQPVPPPLAPVERTRHPSPPPSYFQTVSSSSYHGGSNNNPSSHINYVNNNNNSNNRSSRSVNQNSQRQNRMATIQSILAGGSGTTWSNEDDILLADVLLRHENTLRRSLGLSNNQNNRNCNSNSNNNFNNSVHNSSTNSNARNRGNPMLTQRELIELLLRLTYHSNSGGTGHSVSSTTGSINRSDSRSGSDSHSTTSSVATTRSTASAASTTSNGKATNGATSCSKLTISEVEEDDTAVISGQEGGGGGNNRTAVGVTMRNSKAAGLDLSLSRLSVGENDSGVASSTCSTVGSEVADSVIGSIKMISRDLSEEAMKLKKQPHAVDDDGVQDVVVVADEGKLTISSSKMNARLHEQQLAATIHPERKCGGGAGDDDEHHECTNGVLVPTNRTGGGNRDDSAAAFQKGNSKSAGYIGSTAGSGSDGEIIEETVVDRNGNGKPHNGTSTPVDTAAAVVSVPATIISLPASGGVHFVPSENTISTASTAQV